MDDFARLACVSRPTLYRLFGGRDRIQEEVTWANLASVRIDLLDRAREIDDLDTALRTFLRQNARMFSELGETLPAMLELARKNPEIDRVVNLTYRGRRIASLKTIAKRVASEGRLADGWKQSDVVDSLSVLTAWESFDTLARQGHSSRRIGDALFSLCRAFLTPRPR
jgi:AcrR family transcriptional regulator